MSQLLLVFSMFADGCGDFVHGYVTLRLLSRGVGNVKETNVRVGTAPAEHINGPCEENLEKRKETSYTNSRLNFK